MRRGRRVRNLQKARHIDQEPKQTRHRHADQEPLTRRGSVLFVEQLDHLWDLATARNNGNHDKGGEHVVIVDEVERRVFDALERALDHDRVQRGRDRGGDAEHDAQGRDIDVGRDAGHEPGKDDHARGDHEFGESLAQDHVGEDHCERQDQASSDLTRQCVLELVKKTPNRRSMAIAVFSFLFVWFMFLSLTFTW